MIGIVGGTGLYDIEGLTDRQWRKVASPFGEPSDELLFGRLGAREVVFLPRHGRGHRIPPHEINYRANIDALKRAGVTQRDLGQRGRLAARGSAARARSCSSIRSSIARCGGRRRSSAAGCVAHVSMGHPTCARLLDDLASRRRAARPAVSPRRDLRRDGGPAVLDDGRVASCTASWGADVIGMTNMPEAKLAREAELCYATVAMVTDFDCWHPDHDHVEVSRRRSR